MPVEEFFGLASNGIYSFSECLDVYKSRLPKNLLPIAEEATGLECLSISGEDYGKVYYWDRAFEVTGGEPDYSNVYLLADSFTEFLDMLYGPDLEEWINPSDPQVGHLFQRLGGRVGVELLRPQRHLHIHALTFTIDT